MSQYSFLAHCENCDSLIFCFIFVHKYISDWMETWFYIKNLYLFFAIIKTNILFFPFLVFFFYFLKYFYKLDIKTIKNTIHLFLSTLQESSNNFLNAKLIALLAVSEQTCI